MRSEASRQPLLLCLEIVCLKKCTFTALLDGSFFVALTAWHTRHMSLRPLLRSSDGNDCILQRRQQKEILQEKEPFCNWRDCLQQAQLKTIKVNGGFSQKVILRSGRHLAQQGRTWGKAGCQGHIIITGIPHLAGCFLASQAQAGTTPYIGSLL